MEQLAAQLRRGSGPTGLALFESRNVIDERRLEGIADFAAGGRIDDRTATDSATATGWVT